MSVTPFYAALFAIVFLVVSVRAIRARRASGIAIGTRGDKGLERAARVHANFAEYVPFALLLIAFNETRGITPVIIHGLCIALLIGRICHAWGVSQDKENLRFRVSGMVLTLATLVIATLALLSTYLA